MQKDELDHLRQRRADLADLLADLHKVIRPGPARDDIERHLQHELAQAERLITAARPLPSGPTGQSQSP